MGTKVVLLPGDGIGPAISSAVVRILDAAGADIEWETHHAGAETLASHGDTLPEETLEAIRRDRVDQRVHRGGRREPWQLSDNQRAVVSLAGKELRVKG